MPTSFGRRAGSSPPRFARGSTMVEYVVATGILLGALLVPFGDDDRSAVERVLFALRTEHSSYMYMAGLPSLPRDDGTGGPIPPGAIGSGSSGDGSGNPFHPGNGPSGSEDGWPFGPAPGPGGNDSGGASRGGDADSTLPNYDDLFGGEDGSGGLGTGLVEAPASDFCSGVASARLRQGASGALQAQTGLDTGIESSAGACEVNTPGGDGPSISEQIAELYDLAIGLVADAQELVVEQIKELLGFGDEHQYESLTAICNLSQTGCTAEIVDREKLKCPAPGACRPEPVITDDTSDVPILGRVIHTVDEGMVLINETIEGMHILDPGTVTRITLVEDGIVYIHTLGVGSGILPGTNEVLGGAAFVALDIYIRETLGF